MEFLLVNREPASGFYLAFFALEKDDISPEIAVVLQTVMGESSKCDLGGERNFIFLKKFQRSFRRDFSSLPDFHEICSDDHNNPHSSLCVFISLKFRVLEIRQEDCFELRQAGRIFYPAENFRVLKQGQNRFIDRQKNLLVILIDRDQKHDVDKIASPGYSAAADRHPDLGLIGVHVHRMGNRDAAEGCG